MERFNLVNDPWIEVLETDKYDKTLVSLKDIFINAHNYEDIIGDMKIQDFSIMRTILAIMHTVFSRVDENGIAHPGVDIDDKMLMAKRIDKEDYLAYKKSLVNTWKNIWEEGKFPSVVNEYLDKWEDRFYLYSDKYPFYQITEDLMSDDRLEKPEFYRNNQDSGKILNGSVEAKTINRTICDSNNKPALFSPRAGNNKNKLSDAEAARWLITFQQYTGNSDKTKYKKKYYEDTGVAGGWLYNLGAVYLRGRNLFETLMLNFVIFNDKFEDLNYNIQKPIWEKSPSEIIDSRLNELEIDNIASLYTLPSRAIYLNSNHKEDELFYMYPIKFPEIKKENMFLEPMTMFTFYKNGKFKDSFMPQTFRTNYAAWKYLEKIVLDYEPKDEKDFKTKNIKVGVIRWLEDIDKCINLNNLTLRMLTLKDNGQAASKVPVDELYNELYLNKDILLKNDENNTEDYKNAVLNISQITMNIINNVYRRYLIDVAKIRNLEEEKFYTSELDKINRDLDPIFIEFIEGIDAGKNKKEIINNWKDIIRKEIYKHAYEIYNEASKGDYNMKTIDKKEMNIATIFNKFAAITYKITERAE